MVSAQGNGSFIGQLESHVFAGLFFFGLDNILVKPTNSVTEDWQKSVDNLFSSPSIRTQLASLTESQRLTLPWKEELAPSWDWIMMSFCALREAAALSVPCDCAILSELIGNVSQPFTDSSNTYH